MQQGARTLAHIFADHSVDAAWAPHANNSVHAHERISGTVYVGGDFSIIAGQPRRNLAALDAVSGAALPWNPDVCCDLSPDQRSRVLTLETRPYQPEALALQARSGCERRGPSGASAPP